MARTPSKRKNGSSSVENLPRTGPGPSPGPHVAGRPSPPFHLTANDSGPATPVGRSRPPKYAIDGNMLPPGQQLPSSLARNASTGGARVAGIQLGNCGNINLPSMSNGGRSSLSVKSSDHDNDHERSSSSRAASKYDTSLNLSSLPCTDNPRGDFHRLQAVSNRNHVQAPPARLMDVRSPPLKWSSHQAANMNSPASTVTTATMKSAL